MPRKRIIFITHQNDPGLVFFHENFSATLLNKQPSGKQKFHLYKDLIFGYYHTPQGIEKVFTAENGLSKEAWELTQKLIVEAEWDSNDQIILAVHWGGRTIEEYRELVQGINKKQREKDMEIFLASYWGSRSRTYRKGSYESIVDDIRSFLYPDSSILRGIHEIIELQYLGLKAFREEQKKHGDFLEHDSVVLEEIETATSKLQNEIRELRYGY